MTNVVADISMSLDGFVTGPRPDLKHGLGDGGEACPVGPFITPAVRPVHEVEKATAHHHCAGCLFRLPEHSGVHVVAAVHRPGVQRLATVSQSVFEIGPRSGYEPIERHRYVRDNVGHPASSLERDM